MFPGVLEYSTYDKNVLGRDLLRIERYLRARGYYQGKVSAARVVRLDDGHVRVEIRVHEGEPVRVARIDPGIAALPFELVLALNAARKMAEGDIFDEAVLEQDQRRVLRVLGEAGYAFAKVEAKARVDIATRSAHVMFQVSPGPPARYGKVTFVGLHEVPESKVSSNLDIREGDPYNEKELEDAERALINLGVFSTVELRPDRSKPESQSVPIQVHVEESSLRTLRLGGGTRFDVLRLSTHLQTGWEHKNFLGGMRYFSVNAQPGVTLFPTRIDHLEPWSRYLWENRVSVELRQPSFLEGRTTGFVSGEYNVYPLLYPLPDGVDPADEPIIGYQEIVAASGVERAFLGHRLRLVPSYNWRANFPFSYQGANALGSVLVSFPELVATLDFRDDPLQTKSGVYLSNSVQVAGYLFGGTVSDVRVQPEARTYLPIGKSVLATRVTLGFLFPGNYGDTLVLGSSEAQAAELDPTDPAVVADQQKLLFRAFYSGGPSSNRGYPYRGVGPHGPIGFLVPTGLNCSLEPETPGGEPLAVEDLPAGCIRPLGGLTLWEASIEARVPLFDPLQIALFLDASNLTREIGRLDLQVPHMSTGIGVRYGTPVGPIRLDIGWRIPGAQALGKSELPPEAGRPGSPLFGVFPGAVHLAIGEAF